MVSDRHSGQVTAATPGRPPSAGRIWAPLRL